MGIGKDFLPPGWGWGGVNFPDSGHIQASPRATPPHRALTESKPNPSSLNSGSGQVKECSLEAQATLGQGGLGSSQAGMGGEPGRVEGSVLCFSTPPGMEDDHLQRSA